MKELIKRTSFLDEHYSERSVSIYERIYCLLNEIHSLPICAHPDCNNIVEWNNDNRSYRKYCCRKHCMSDPGMRDKSRNTKIQKYGDENYNNRDKARETCERIYGIDQPMKLKEFQDKARRTNKLKYDVEFPSQLKEVQNLAE